jgi:ATP-binding cassette subfamily B protein
MDRSQLPLALLPRGLLAVSFLALAPTLVGQDLGTPTLAACLGAILLAYRALLKLVQGVADLAAARIAWQQVAPLFEAAARPEIAASLVMPLGDDDRARRDGHPVIEAQELFFRYRHQGEPVLRGCSLRIAEGDRLLLEGPSGSGKSTLCSLLIGLRPPESGLLLLQGLDQRTLGADRWHRHVVAAPQFHENHILASSLAFNLLMGRDWPPSMEDLAEAETTCLELGLGPLLEKMPARLHEMVGETGWQLSHGERSRVYIARALLQRADLVLLDESFAALDPETLRSVLKCVLARARTLLVIDHP